MTSPTKPSDPVKKVLLADPPPPPEPKPDLVAAAAKQSGVSPFTQFYHMLKLRYGAQGIRFNDYYDLRLFDPSKSMEEKCEFVGSDANLELNKRLSNADEVKLERQILMRKALAEAYFRSKDLSVTTTQATLGYSGQISYIPNLDDEAAVAEFLREKAVYPLFAKPDKGSRSVGSARIDSFDAATDTLKIGNGQSIKVADFAREIIEDYSDGFAFQHVVEQHPEATRVAGPAVGTVRVVTVHDGEKANLLYALWKLPAPNAMSDNFWQDGSLLAALNPDDGTIRTVRRGTGIRQETLDTHPTTGAAFDGFAIPMWDEVVKLATAAHDTLPKIGILGFDIALGKDGPLIVECNTNPFHTLYQIAEGRGIYCKELRPRIEKIASRFDGADPAHA
ncbi:hypothetical protein JQU17_08195 [Ponticoccus sp. SC2-23]|uniref:sugar-transfer associated ATP-grasp domain-containing protein n=1 Tax=Alexandriicola marinus TaxID=2081710 RepID=UPI000FD8951F|nr:sugar-transfer associated ATP-grasp domain-containing protein [Alexandriicola marinus]MBM1220335.1 hypothetical protein [Ponticoccus sp. SC6-9]MBM1225021.1 hypothetical protein [Ponticoccus sp. SC6-15]MBM1228535.1 hypothetical protein [Ponticoccus sp. SC6-38]MBM1233828.1 hypothetical protein [Ponticoccus sp. SC6-45]MBM1239036.1 hypothetical protein [Ponticoccus sp. SC6-49]MBM1242818.1 hypothetical protein [Ponticoccus sp. SC2-64]MBM1247352.1 hypothetical protein [Ponticoccus sp. SC6-42]M